MDTWASIAIAAVPGLMALIGVALGLPKQKADSASTLTGAALALVNELQDELRDTKESLKNSANELKKILDYQFVQDQKIALLTNKIEALEAENRQLKERAEYAEKEVDKLRHELHVQQSRVTRLRNQMAQAGLKPDTAELG